MVGAVQYGDPGAPTQPNGGTRTNHVTLVGADTAQPVALRTVVGGAVTAGSTQAVNGGQLFATDQVAQQAAALGANAVQYDAGRTSVSFGGSGAPPVTLRNIAAGTTATDAANVGQLQAGMQATVAQANSYADARVNAALSALDFDLKRVRREVSITFQLSRNSMAAIDRDLARISYHHARAAQERAAALKATTERSRTAHLHLAAVHEVYAVFGPPADQRSAGTITGAP